MKVFAVLESFWKAKLEFLSIGRKSWKVWGRLGSTYAFLRASVPQTYPSHLNKNFISKLQTNSGAWLMYLLSFCLLNLPLYSLRILDWYDQEFSCFGEIWHQKNISIGNLNIILQESGTCAYLFRRRHDITCCLPASVGLPTQGTLLWVIVALGRKVISFFSSGEHYFSRKFSFQTQLVGVHHHCCSRHHWCIWRGRIIASQ